MQRAASLGHVAINWQLNSNWPQLLLLLFSDGLLFRLLLLLLLLLFAAFGNCFWHVYHLGLSFDWALAADKHLFIYYVQLGHIKHESVCLSAYDIYFCLATVWGHAWTGTATQLQIQIQIHLLGRLSWRFSPMTLIRYGHSSFFF